MLIDLSSYNGLIDLSSYKFAANAVFFPKAVLISHHQQTLSLMSQYG